LKLVRRRDATYNTKKIPRDTKSTFHLRQIQRGTRKSIRFSKMFLYYFTHFLALGLGIWLSKSSKTISARLRGSVQQFLKRRPTIPLWFASGESARVSKSVAALSEVEVELLDR
jgi:hypothetical protein